MFHDNKGVYSSENILKANVYAFYNGASKIYEKTTTELMEKQKIPQSYLKNLTPCHSSC